MFAIVDLINLYIFTSFHIPTYSTQMPRTSITYRYLRESSQTPNLVVVPRCQLCISAAHGSAPTSSWVTLLGLVGHLDPPSSIF